jgi:hypothetical protein
MRDDLAGAAKCDAVPVGELLHEGVDAAGIEVDGSVQDPPVGLGGGAAEEDVDVLVPSRLEDAQGVIREDTVRLVPVVDDGDHVVVDSVRGAGIGRLRLGHRVGQQVRIDGEETLGVVADVECGEDSVSPFFSAPGRDLA